MQLDDAAQRDGERRVRSILIDPLLALGLTKPGTMRKAQFEVMLRTLEQTLAYMGADDLAELRERAAAHPGGKDRDRFPLALNITKWAKEVKRPEGAGPSPFIGRVMAHDVGRVALERGYAPELLAYIRDKRGEWPGAWTLSKIKDSADPVVRRYDDLIMRRDRGDALSRDEAEFVLAREHALRECEEVRRIGLERAA